MNGQDEGQGIPLGDGGGGGPSMDSLGSGGGGGPDYPDLSMSSDHPDMDNAPEEGSATIHFHKHSHTRERHPTKPGTHKHHVRLKVHSIKFNRPKKPKVSKSDIAEALASAGGGEGGGPPPGAGDGGDGGMPPPPPPTG
jgi:hypothetical protein